MLIQAFSGEKSVPWQINEIDSPVAGEISHVGKITACYLRLKHRLFSLNVQTEKCLLQCSRRFHKA